MVEFFTALARCFSTSERFSPRAIARAAFAGLLYVIVSGGEVENALKGIIEDALNSKKK